MLDDQDNFFQKRYGENSPLKKNDYKGNVISDETDNQDLTQQDIDEVDVNLEAQQNQQSHNQQDLDNAQDALDDIAPEDMAEQQDPLLKQLLKALGDKIKKKKKQKKDSTHHVDNDLAPSLGQEVIGTSNVTREESKRRKSVIESFRSFLSVDRALRAQIVNEGSKLRNAGVNNARDLNNDGVVDGKDSAVNVKNEHRIQIADAINDIGEHSAKGRWADGLSDVNKQGKGGGRGI